MRIVVYPHDLDIGGSQINAIELAARLRDDGHHVWIYGQSGSLLGKIRELDLNFIESPDPGRRPSLTVARHLRRLAEDLEIDVIHGYEWPPALEAAWSVRGLATTVAVATVMSMSVAPFIPKHLPLTVGTEQIAAAERAFGRRRVEVIEPPVDLSTNGPDIPVDAAGFRADLGLRDTDFVVVAVTRLANQLKLEGLLSAIDAVRRLAKHSPTRLVIVGDGPARSEVAERAAAANRETGEETVVLTGEMMDPRAAYAAAGLCLAMGGSALRSMAWAKPVVVQGERGFFRLLDADSLKTFLWQGWYGIGEAHLSGSDTLVNILTPVIGRPDRLQELGAFSRQVIESRFSLEAAADKQVALYEQSLARRSDRVLENRDGTAAALRFAIHQLQRRARRLAGRRATDDFNSKPVALSTSLKTSTNLLDEFVQPGGPQQHKGIVYLSGAPWDAVAGTDRHLASALAVHRRILWVDPPVSALARRRRKMTVPRISSVAPGITRLHVIAPPGVGRPVIRVFARWWSDRLVKRKIAMLGGDFSTVIGSSPEPVLAGWRHSPLFKIYFATDDFVAGASLLGFSTKYLDKSRRRNLRAADLSIAVSHELGKTLHKSAHRVAILPNGCDPGAYSSVRNVPPAAEIRLNRPIAGLVGQLNDRLDLSMLEAVADMGDSLLIIGPRYEESTETRSRLDSLISRSNVQWVGRQTLENLPSFLTSIDVGLTPYADNPFNRASFPLKTLEYLAAGKRVVSTDLPAARDLDPDMVVLAADAREFADAVHQQLAARDTNLDNDRRQNFAQRNSWTVRASAWISLIP